MATLGYCHAQYKTYKLPKLTQADKCSKKVSTRKRQNLDIALHSTFVSKTTRPGKCSKKSIHKNIVTLGCCLAVQSLHTTEVVKITEPDKNSRKVFTRTQQHLVIASHTSKRTCPEKFVYFFQVTCVVSVNL